MLIMFSVITNMYVYMYACGVRVFVPCVHGVCVCVIDIMYIYICILGTRVHHTIFYYPGPGVLHKRKQ